MSPDIDDTSWFPFHGLKGLKGSTLQSCVGRCSRPFNPVCWESLFPRGRQVAARLRQMSRRNGHCNPKHCRPCASRTRTLS